MRLIYIFFKLRKMITRNVTCYIGSKNIASIIYIHVIVCELVNGRNFNLHILQKQKQVGRHEFFSPNAIKIKQKRGKKEDRKKEESDKISL